MAFYELPRLGQVVAWDHEKPRTTACFSHEGEIVILHATSSPALSAARWQTQTLRLSLLGTNPAPGSREVPPLLCLRWGSDPVQAAAICLLDLVDEHAMLTWLNAIPAGPRLRLVLLRQDEQDHTQARAEALREVGSPTWLAGDALLRQQLAQQCLATRSENAGSVQAAGRQEAARIVTGQMMPQSDWSVLLQAPSGRHPERFSILSTHPTSPFKNGNRPE